MNERQKSARRREADPHVPDFYMPAMWPLGLQRRLCDWFHAWRQRRCYRRLLKLNDRLLAARDLDRQRVSDRAEMPLRQWVAERRACKGRR